MVQIIQIIAFNECNVYVNSEKHSWKETVGRCEEPREDSATSADLKELKGLHCKQNSKTGALALGWL